MKIFSRARIATASIAAAGLLLSACGDSPATTSPPDNEALDNEAPDTSNDPESTNDGSADAPMVDGDYSHPVLNIPAIAPDGSVFTIADFSGKTIFVETFATWCSTCKRQLGDTNAAAEQASDVVFLALSVEAGLDPAKLAEYAADNGFDSVQFGVLDSDGMAAINEQFGRSALNAPSTPKFVVAADGSLSMLTTGLESVDEILAQVA